MTNFEQSFANWIDKIQYPLMEKYMTNDDYFFLDKKGQQTFNQGRMMFEEKDIFHPLFHPYKKAIITAFYIDDLPMITCDKRYGNDRNGGGEDFVPYEWIITPEWEKIIERNQGKFILPSGMGWKSTLMDSFDCDRELNTQEELFTV